MMGNLLSQIPMHLKLGIPGPARLAGSVYLGESAGLTSEPNVQVPARWNFLLAISPFGRPYFSVIKTTRHKEPVMCLYKKFHRILKGERWACGLHQLRLGSQGSYNFSVPNRPNRFHFQHRSFWSPELPSWTSIRPFILGGSLALKD